MLVVVGKVIASDDSLHPETAIIPSWQEGKSSKLKRTRVSSKAVAPGRGHLVSR